jgi:hypothetical protein
MNPTADDGPAQASGERAFHLVRLKGRLLFSGHNGSGDPCMGVGGCRPSPGVPRHPYAYVVDVGSEHFIDPTDGLIVSRVSRTKGFSPGGLALAARLGWYGFRLIGGEEATKPKPSTKGGRH